MGQFSHLTSSGEATMVNVGAKPSTQRLARVMGEVHVNASCVALLNSKNLEEICRTARIAGIQAAKQTSALVPMCHGINLAHVEINIIFSEKNQVFEIDATSAAHAQTGVEMEAFCAAQISALTIYDMIKAVDPAATIGPFRLSEKIGGNAGHWQRSQVLPSAERDVSNLSENIPDRLPDAQAHDFAKNTETPFTARILIASDRASSGIYKDQGGPIASDWLMNHGFIVDQLHIIPDERDVILQRLQDQIDHQPTGKKIDLLMISGGTGLGSRDVTPQVIAGFADYEIPGFGEQMRHASLKVTPFAVLSRCGAWVKDQTLILVLPGNPKAITQQLDILAPVLPHAIKSLHNQCRSHGSSKTAPVIPSPEIFRMNSEESMS